MARVNTPPQYACGNCGLMGHNKRTCGKEPVVKAPRVARGTSAPAMRIDPTLLASLLTRYLDAGDAEAIKQVAALLAGVPVAPAPVAPVAEEVVSPAVAEDATVEQDGEGYSDFNYAEGVDPAVAAMSGEEFLAYYNEKYASSTDFDLAFGGEDDSDDEDADEDDDGMDEIENELDEEMAAG